MTDADAVANRFGNEVAECKLLVLSYLEAYVKRDFETLNAIAEELPEGVLLGVLLTLAESFMSGGVSAAHRLAGVDDDDPAEEKALAVVSVYREDLKEVIAEGHFDEPS